MRETIGLCCIAKNEEVLIGRMLESCKWADQIVVVDTGSVDRTIEIAESFGAECYKDFIWCDSFFRAQNHAKSKMKTDWIISVDCDEVVLSTEEEIRAAIAIAKDTVRVTMVAEGDVKNEFGFSRIFRNTPEIFWEADIHKHLNIPGEGEPIGNIKIMYGYSPAHELDPDRSLRMLERAVEQNPLSPRELYYLGREYWYRKKYWEAIDMFNQYSKVSTWGAELAEVYLIKAQCYLELKKIEECAMATLSAIKVNSNFKEAIEFMEYISTDENKAQWARMARTASNEGVLWVRTETEPIKNSILISAHEDDETLFAAYTLMRNHPHVLVVTESYIQDERGEVGCDAETRRNESIKACGILGCSVSFLGIRDTKLTEEILTERLKGLYAETIYIPAFHEGGNGQHNLINKVCKEIFKTELIEYTSYSTSDLLIQGNQEIVPSEKEKELKNKAMDCYQSQINLQTMAHHFEYIRNKSEWIL